MATPSEREHIMNLIRKLAALANPENNRFPEEIAAASAKMQELMDRYSIGLVEVMNDIPADRMSAIFAGRQSNSIIGSVKPWHWSLGRAIDRITHTKHYAHVAVGTTTRGTKDVRGRKMSFFGDEKAIETACYLFDEWLDKIDRMSVEATSMYIEIMTPQYADEMDEQGVKQFRHLRGLGDMHPNVYRSSWLDGVMSGIHQALDEQEQSRSQETSTALVKVDRALLVAYDMFTAGWRARSTSSDRGFNNSAYYAGRQIGQTIRIGSKKIGG